MPENEAGGVVGQLGIPFVGWRGLRRGRNHVGATAETGSGEPSAHIPVKIAWLLRFAPQLTAPEVRDSKVENHGKVSSGHGISAPTYRFARALLHEGAQSHLEN